MVRLFVFLRVRVWGVHKCHWLDVFSQLLHSSHLSELLEKVSTTITYNIHLSAVLGGAKLRLSVVHIRSARRVPGVCTRMLMKEILSTYPPLLILPLCPQLVPPHIYNNCVFLFHFAMEEALSAFATSVGVYGGRSPTGLPSRRANETIQLFRLPPPSSWWHVDDNDPFFSLGNSFHFWYLALLSTSDGYE